ncbi:MAG: transposase [Caballeronia sp.]|jgi:hypothetical protein|nr:transposase [Caballeronia sp.]
MLRSCERRAERDQGYRPGPTRQEQEPIKALEHEVHELRQANEILRKASAYFALAEIERGGHVRSDSFSIFKRSAGRSRCRLYRGQHRDVSFVPVLSDRLE